MITISGHSRDGSAAPHRSRYTAASAHYRVHDRARYESDPMARFSATPNFAHDQPALTGVLLTNLGSPDAPTTAAVRRYLKEFLWDRRVVEIPRPVWWLLLNGLVLRRRPKKSARNYQAIWQDDGAPLLTISAAQQQALQTELQTRLGNHDPRGPVRVELAMRYGSPSIADGLQALRAAGARRLLVLPMYPQYSGSTTASTFDEVSRVLRNWRWLPDFRMPTAYHDHPGYIDALANSIRAAWQHQAPAERLLMSFHGLPKYFLEQGDPYHCQCHKTARLLAEKLELPDNRWSITFQSRFGKAEWLQPYTDKTLERLAGEGLEAIDVVCPGFPADCLETLEEMAITNRQVFLDAGGKHYRYIPALNDDPTHIAFLAELARQQMQGWPEAAGDYNSAAATEAARRSRERALALGADN